ncbi:hypothetical protein JTE90_016339 [Oedothorax gibbosus]|uniref:Uncharacterized protein n=1 Tax=Oedothorax gibbosus TaxID=931172 RepID=A0AAV6TGQ5_9ARAC|nr:hypothetical protein JTE90_016339 [Oedothorax gibbosus]
MGTDRHENYTISLDFQGAQKRRTGPAKTRGFYGTASLSPDEPIPGTELLQRKNNFPRGPRRRLRFGCVTALVPKDLSPCPVGEY